MCIATTQRTLTATSETGLNFLVFYSIEEGGHVTDNYFFVVVHLTF
jgi:hypothetical protein